MNLMSQSSELFNFGTKNFKFLKNEEMTSDINNFLVKVFSRRKRILKYSI